MRCTLLVDCGATSHIVNSSKHFTSFDTSFSPTQHYLELADGRKSNELIKAKGNAVFHLCDSNGVTREITLKNALLAPTFPVSLFSVRAATEYGAKITFSKHSNKLETQDTTFNFDKRGQLYFLPTDTAMVTKTLNQWHQDLGHMNFDDIHKLKNITTESAFRCCKSNRSTHTQGQPHTGANTTQNPIYPQTRATQNSTHGTTNTTHSSTYGTTNTTQSSTHQTANATQNSIYQTANNTQNSTQQTANTTQNRTYQTTNATQNSMYPQTRATQTFSNQITNITPSSYTDYMTKHQDSQKQQKLSPTMTTAPITTVTSTMASSKTIPTITTVPTTTSTMTPMPSRLRGRVGR